MSDYVSTIIDKLRIDISQGADISPILQQISSFIYRGPIDPSSAHGSELAAIDTGLEFEDMQLTRQKLLGDLGLCHMLLDVLAMEAYVSNHNTCDLVMETVRILCRRRMSKDTTCTENCDRVLADRGGKKILDAMSNFIMEPHHITGTTCFLIMCLAADSSDRQKILAEEGVSVALAAVLFQYSQDDYAAEMGCRAVRNLATNDEVGANLVSEGIAEALVKVLQESKAPIVIEQAIWAVVNLSCDGDIASIIGAAGVLPCINDALTTYLDSNAAIVEAGCAAIRNLISESVRNMSLLIKNMESLPIPQTLATCLERHRSSDITEVILWACANTASAAELGKSLYHSHVLDIVKGIVAEAVHRNPVDGLSEESISLVESSLWVVRNITNSVSSDSSSESLTIARSPLLREYLRCIRTYFNEGSIPNLRSHAGVVSIFLNVIKCLLSHLLSNAKASSQFDSSSAPLESNTDKNLTGLKASEVLSYFDVAIHCLGVTLSDRIEEDIIDDQDSDPSVSTPLRHYNSIMEDAIHSLHSSLQLMRLIESIDANQTMPSMSQQLCRMLADPLLLERLKGKDDAKLTVLRILDINGYISHDVKSKLFEAGAVKIGVESGFDVQDVSQVPHTVFVEIFLSTISTIATL